MKRSPALAALLALSIALMPSMVFAQGMEFGEDEAAEETPSDDGEEAPDVDTQDPAGLEFGEDEAARTTYSDTDEKQVAVVAVPGPAMDADRRSKVQAEMDRVTGNISAITMVNGAAVLGALEAGGGEACVQEPLCLADAGEQAGAERILVARVVETADGLELKVDYFDVDDKLFIRYDNTPGLGGTAAIVKAVEPALNKIFDVRKLQAGQELTGDEDSSVVRSVIAYGTAGLAVGALVGGIVFGLGAKKIEKDVEGSPKNGDVYRYTQIQARDAIRPAESKATTANVFYGLAVGLAGVSALFFLIGSGSDVADDQEASRGIRDLKVAPTVSSHGLGFGAGFSF